jgi:hypothetical protein
VKQSNGVWGRASANELCPTVSGTQELVSVALFCKVVGSFTVYNMNAGHNFTCEVKLVLLLKYQFR